MNTAETILWSAAAGSIGLVVLLGAADALFSRSRASVQSLIYLTACWFFFTLLSGLAATMRPSPDASWLHTAQVLVESLHSPGWIRTMGLRVASSLRRPLEVSALNGERIRISADISVGMVHLTGAGRDVAQPLHEAEEMAAAARGMRSRAALLDEISRQAVPVENAQLGVSWHAMRSGRPHHARNGQGARPRKTPA